MIYMIYMQGLVYRYVHVENNDNFWEYALFRVCWKGDGEVYKRHKCIGT